MNNGMNRRRMWKFAGRTGASYCFYEIAHIEGLGNPIFDFIIVPVSDFWGAK